MEFAIFSDDFFETEESEQKEQTAPESSWTAHRSEPGVSHEISYLLRTWKVVISLYFHS